MTPNQQNWLFMSTIFIIGLVLCVLSDLEPALAGDHESISLLGFHTCMLVLALIIYITDFQIGD